ncbi:MAG: hypothetical protein H6757_00690 [Candidatus Omnitrophica bacterium]|nr:hypothetical protein [Candidatus Omnitrophota bacterium]
MSKRRHTIQSIVAFAMAWILGAAPPAGWSAELISVGQGNYMAAISVEEAQMKYGATPESKDIVEEKLSDQEKIRVQQRLAELEETYQSKELSVALDRVLKVAENVSSGSVAIIQKNNDVKQVVMKPVLPELPNIISEADSELPEEKDMEPASKRGDGFAPVFLAGVSSAGGESVNPIVDFLTVLEGGENHVVYNSEDDIRAVEAYYAKQTGGTVSEQVNDQQKEKITLDDARKNLSADAQNNKEIELKRNVLSESWIKEFVFNLLRLRHDQWSVSVGPDGQQRYLAVIVDAAKLNGLKSAAAAATDYLLAFLVQASAVYIEPRAEKFTDWMEQNENIDWKLVGNQARLIRHIRVILENSGSDEDLRLAEKTGGQVIERIELNDRTAALHVLNNLPEMHPFLATLLRKAQLSNDEKLEYLRLVNDIYRLNSEASKDKGLFIRYKNQIFQGFLPELGDADGTYELVKSR